MRIWKSTFKRLIYDSYVCIFIVLFGQVIPSFKREDGKKKEIKENRERIWPEILI